MSVYYLNADDFGMEQGHLVSNVPGLLLVMFTSKKCKYCDDFMPEFKALPSAIKGMNFGVCNVDDRNRAVLQMANSSSTPIKGVPKFLLYNEGMPYVEYTGARTTQAVILFLKEIFAKLSQKRQFEQPRRTRVGAGAGTGTSPPQHGMQPAQGQAREGGGYPSRAQGGMAQAPPSFKVNPSTGVKEYETSYGRPYNTANEQEFLAYEQAYLQK